MDTARVAKRRMISLRWPSSSYPTLSFFVVWSGEALVFAEMASVKRGTWSVEG